MPIPTPTRRAGLLMPVIALTLSGCLLDQQARPDAAAGQPVAPVQQLGEPTPVPAAVSAPSQAVSAPSQLASVVRPEPEPGATPAETCDLERDLWVRVRKGLALSQREHPGVETDLEWYVSHPRYLERVVERARPYFYLIVDEVERRGLPGELALLPVVESAFQPFAYSHGRAAGLWQFIPGTARRFGLRDSWWYDGRRDVAEATRAALDYLEYLHGYFDGDWLLALAAYNSGEGTVARAVRRNEARGKGTDFWSLDLPRETRGYVPKLLALSRIVADPGRFDLSLAPIDNLPFLASVDVGSQIDLSLAAELAGIDIEELYLYNPAFNRWATDPDGPHRLLVPLEAADRLQQALAEHPPEKRVAWERHRIRNGESLIAIAQRYGTTVDTVKQVNNLRGHFIRAGDSLIIPVAREAAATYALSQDQRLKSLQALERDGHRSEYVVRSGDTLWNIARRFGVGVTSLAKWNGMAPRDVLKPGRKLVVWTREPTPAGALTPASFTHPFQESATRRIAYTVRSGDSLARISQRFRVTVDQLRDWNKLHGQKYLQPGQRLTLYVDVTQSESI